MDRVLGIDIGSYSVKVAIIKMDYNACTLESYFEQKIHYHSESDENSCKMDAVQTLLKQHPLHYNAVYAALGCDTAIIKKFEFYKLKRRDRQRVLEDEFDSMGLFSMEEYSVEYHTINYKGNKTPLLGVFFKKQAARDLIAVLSSAALDPRIIDIDNMTYLNVMQFLPAVEIKQSEESVEGVEGVEAQPVVPLSDLIVDIGHQKTSLTVVGNSKVLSVRVLQMAGKYFTLCLQKALNVSFDEAENIKHNISSEALNSSTSKEADILKNCYTELSLEIKRTIQSLMATESIELGRVFLTGSSSLYQNIVGIFEQNLGLTIQKLEAKGESFHVKTIPEHPFHAETFTQAVAIALRGNYNKNNSKMNIRHGELAAASNYEQIIEQAFVYGKMVSAVLVCLLAVYLFRYFAYVGKIQKMQMDYRKDVVTLFGQEPPELKIIARQKDWNFHDYSVQAHKLLLADMENKKNLVRDMNSDPFVLQVLNKVSKSVPKNVYFEVSDFKITDNNLYVEADTDSSAAVEQIVSDFKKIDLLTNVQKKSQQNKAGTAGQIIQFVLTATIVK